MKKEICIVAAFLGFFLAGTARGQKPDFSGAWVMDPERSFSMGNVTAAEMTISHRDPEFRLDARLTSPEGTKEVHEVWQTDGQEHDATPAGSRAGLRVVRKAFWLPDRRRLVLAEKTEEEKPEGRSVQSVTRKYALSADGGVLTVDYYIDRPQGSGEAKRVFRKRGSAARQASERF